MFRLPRYEVEAREEGADLGQLVLRVPEEPVVLVGLLVELEVLHNVDRHP